MITYIVIDDAQLTDEWAMELQQLFDGEYLQEHGYWTREQPYGYASFDLRALAFVDNHVIGHVACQKRTLLVGGQEVIVAGTGGVLVHPDHRQKGIAQQLLGHLQRASVEQLGVAYGYLGCREAVVPFYEACGYVRIEAEEHSLERMTHQPVIATGTPIMICDGTESVTTFPTGIIDLQGLPW